MSNELTCWSFEETCPSCDTTHVYSFDDVDDNGFIICKSCGCRMHACSLCDKQDNCINCDEHDTDKSKWHSCEMLEFKQMKLNHALELNAAKQKLFKEYLDRQADIVKAMYDDTVDADTFEHMLWCNDAEVVKKAEPEVEEDKLYVDNVGNTWFRHRGHDFHIYRLAHAGHDDDGYLQFTDKMVLCIEEMSGFYMVPDALCENFGVRSDNAWSYVAKWLLPAADEYIDRMNKEIH